MRIKLKNFTVEIKTLPFPKGWVEVSFPEKFEGIFRDIPREKFGQWWIIARYAKGKKYLKLDSLEKANQVLNYLKDWERKIEDLSRPDYPQGPNCPGKNGVCSAPYEFGPACTGYCWDSCPYYEGN